MFHVFGEDFSRLHLFFVVLIVSRFLSLLNLARDSPAFVRRQVVQSVWRWRWQKVEERIPALKHEAGGLGAHTYPIFRLLRAKPDAEWGPRDRAALRSAVCNRQRTQCRLHRAGMVSSRNCRLCVQLGYCIEEDTDPAYHGTLLHRIWKCPALEERRRQMVPRWLYASAASMQA